MHFPITKIILNILGFFTLTTPLIYNGYSKFYLIFLIMFLLFFLYSNKIQIKNYELKMIYLYIFLFPLQFLFILNSTLNYLYYFSYLIIIIIIITIRYDIYKIKPAVLFAYTSYVFYFTILFFISIPRPYNSLAFYILDNRFPDYHWLSFFAACLFLISTDFLKNNSLIYTLSISINLIILFLINARSGLIFYIFFQFLTILREINLKKLLLIASILPIAVFFITLNTDKLRLFSSIASESNWYRMRDINIIIESLDLHPLSLLFGSPTLFSNNKTFFDQLFLSSTAALGLPLLFLAILQIALAAHLKPIDISKLLIPLLLSEFILLPQIFFIFSIFLILFRI